ncbi:MAG: GIN domain-containing protein [Egibacteraceae bacterium]
MPFAAVSPAASRVARVLSGVRCVVGAGRNSEATIEQTGTESLTIEAEDNILPLLTSEVADGMLRLATSPDVDIFATQGIVYRLTVDDLDRIVISGAGNVTTSGLQTGTFTATISGTGNLTASGAVDAQDVTISGAGIYGAEGVESDAATVNIPGQGSAVVKVNDTLDEVLHLPCRAWLPPFDPAALGCPNGPSGQRPPFVLAGLELKAR